MGKLSFFVVFACSVLVTSCSTEPAAVEVTKIVEVPIDVTRIVPEISEIEVTRTITEVEEVEVTRLVEVEIEVEVTRVVESVVTATPTPRPIPPSQVQLEDYQADVGQSIISSLESNLYGVQRVNLVRWSPGRLEVELFTNYLSRDNQPEVSWNVVTYLTEGFSGMDPGKRMALTGNEEFVFALTTYSEDGDYRHISETDFDTFEKLDNRSISYEEWIAAANAGFR